jgi:HEAT repeat protein
MVAIQILVEQWPEDVFSTLSYALAKESDPRLRELELHVMSLYRDPASAEVFAVYMADPDPRVRAAAADGLGILRGAASGLPADPALPMAIRLNSQTAGGHFLRCWGDEFARLVRLGLATPSDVPFHCLSRRLHATSWSG